MPLDGYAGARWLAEAAILTLVGVAVLPALLSRSLPDSSLVATIRRRAAALGLLAAALLLLATFLRLWYQTRSFLEPGDTIWTESSYKYDPPGVRQLVEPAGFVQRNQWIDERARFALTLFQAI